MIVRAFFILTILAVGIVATLAQMDQSSRLSPAYARFVPEAFSGNAARERSKLALQLGDSERAAKEARAQVLLRPMPAESLSVLALSALAAGDIDMASEALGAASQRGWRDPVSQLASGQSALQQGEYAIVAQRISALLATGELREPAMALLIELLKQPDGRAAFAEQLASPGYWQANSLLSIYRVVDKGQWAQTLALAQEKGAELECGRFKALAQAYENDGRGAEAALFMPADCRAT